VKDLLGIVIAQNGDYSSVIATKFGLAHQPTQMRLGTWLRMTVTLDNSDEHTLELYGEGRNWIVSKSEKIMPAVYTRVIPVQSDQFSPRSDDEILVIYSFHF
jgi:hypothetical protein